MLVTGFEPFITGQGVQLTHNPTADVARAIHERRPDIQSGVLPVSFERTPKALHALFETHQPEVWIGLGYAHHRTQVDVEAIAVNVEHASGRDNDGDNPFNRAVVPDGPAAYRTQLDVAHALENFSAHGVDANVSFHAGTFLCNQTFYLGCHEAATTHIPKLASFIHVPPMRTHEGLIAALIEIFDASIETRNR